MIRRDRHLRFCGVLLVLNLAFIWGNSLLPGELSGALSDWVKLMLSRFLPVAGMEGSGGGLLRKLAHFTEFTTLGLLLAWRCAMLGQKWRRALAMGMAAACLDETIQIFVPDRGPGIRDVGIDTCGVMAGIILLHLGYRIRKQKRSTTFGGKQ